MWLRVVDMHVARHSATGRELTPEAVMSVLVILLLLEPVGLEQGVGWVLEAGNGVGGW